ncbi:MAG: molybdenum cofactor guanylyltransferase [Firmicutes bacterium]|nr:molybdenum cofactor guanylyltransferase [Bacillota bacterium]
MTEFKSAVILAGGRSTRMGFDKQMLKVQGKPIVDHLITLLCTRFEDIMVSSPTPTPLYALDQVRVIQDIHDNIGPLGGIHSALVHAKSEAVFTIACDMPFLDIPYIDYMMAQMEGGAYDACLTSHGGHLETFHAFYCRSALPVLEAELAQGRYSVNRFACKIDTLIIPEEIAKQYLPDWRAFTNLNTPQDYEEFCREQGALM